MIAIRLYALAALLFAPCAGAFAADSFRCGSDVSSQGVHWDKVLENCGEPTERSEDTWVYDRGPEDFTVTVHFGADGTVNRIEME